MTLAYISETNPINKMKISEPATKYGMLDIEQLYEAKCKGLSLLQKGISKRQTLGMDTVHTERVYLSNLGPASSCTCSVWSRGSKEALGGRLHEGRRKQKSQITHV